MAAKLKIEKRGMAILVEGPNRRTYFWKRTIQWLFHRHLVLLLSKWFQTRIFLWEFRSSHTNLHLRNHWANCNQTLVEWSLGGPLWNLCPVNLTSKQDGRQTKNRLWRPSWSEVWNAGHNFGRGQPKDHFSKVWLRLAQ
jgi:hypothetical protein